MTRFGRPKRTQAEKKAAALQFVIFANKSESEKIATLIGSYGFTMPEALKLVTQTRGMA